MWEIFTFGSQPYTGIDNTDIGTFLRKGKRLTFPDTAHEQL